VLAVIATVGLVVSRFGSDAGPVESTTAVPVAPTQASEPGVLADPGDRASASPTGVADVVAARAAGVAAVAMTGEVVAAGMFSRGDVVAGFATPSYAPVLAAHTTAQVNAFVVGLGSTGADPAGLRVVEAPVTATATGLEAGRVQVEVWSVLAVSAPGVSVGRQAWRTVTVEMVEVGGRWLVDDWSSSPGPAPAMAPEGAFGGPVELAERLAWPSVLGGGDR
jgi:hypothetical protein